jgi:hypothetical protein
MAYRLGANESLSDGFARISGDLLDEAIVELSENIRIDPVDAVHEARKAIKKERALLRLMRGAVPKHHRRREDKALRDAGRQLSEVRDAEVMLETFEALDERYSQHLPRHTFEQLRIHFERGPDWQHSKLARRSAAEGAVDDLTDVRVRMGDWKIRIEGWPALEPGIEQVYRAGRLAWRSADTDRTLETWHTWRKRVKDLWYQQRLLADVGGPAVRGQAQRRPDSRTGRSRRCDRGDRLPPQRAAGRGSGPGRARLRREDAGVRHAHGASLQGRPRARHSRAPDRRTLEVVAHLEGAVGAD